MAGQTVYYAGQTMPTINGQTVSYPGQIAPPVAGLTVPLTTGQTGHGLVRLGAWPVIPQTGSLEISPGFHTTTSSADFNYYSSSVNTVSHATPHVPNAYNDHNRGYSHDTGYGQYDNIAPQQPPFRPSNPPPNPPRPEIMEVRNHARVYQMPYPNFYDVVPYPPDYKIPEFAKFSGKDSRTTCEHVGQFLAQCGRASSMDTCKLRLFSLSLSGTAFTWFTSLPSNSISAWAQLEQKFHDYFHTNETELKLSDLTLVRHKYNESVVDYIERIGDVKNRCFNLKITDKDLADIAYNGLLDSIKEKLNGQIFLDIDHVLHEALAQESRVDDNSLQASLDENAISCIAEPSDGSDCVNNLCNDAVTSIAESNVGPDCLTSLDDNATTIIAEPSIGSDFVTSLDNDGIAEPSNGSDCVASLENSIIENIAELSDGSGYITSIALSPKTESLIGYVDVGKDDDNVLRDSSEIEPKVAMHTYQRPYPEHVDSVPYPQGFEVPNFTKFIGEDTRTTKEHIGQFIEQCGKAGSDDLLKLKLFPLSLSNFASTWYSLLAPNSISTWSQMEHEFHDYFKDASLIEKRPVDDLSVTCETISVTPMPKTGIVSNPFPISPIDDDKWKGKSVIIGDPRPKNRIKNAKAEDHKVAKDESSSSQKTKKPKLTFEMLMGKYKKGLAGQRFDNQTSDSKRPRSSRRERFGQTPKQSEPSTITTPYKPPVVMPWYPHPMSPFGYPFMYYMPWMPQPPMPCHQGWKQSPRTVPSNSNSRQDRFSQKNRSGGSKVKKVWVRKEAKAPEVVAIKEKSQDVQVPTEDAAKTIQAEKTEADAVAVNIGGLTKLVGWSNRQTTAGLTDGLWPV
uniref:OSJNBb0005B05.9 protein n=1 Tax=Oryza sativa subsp. japonica TaxID=39947 RepID=Q7FAY9_ORYSJ|nr:OSJNBb0005B05.9 [Oryza sativa Japonica Group]